MNKTLVLTHEYYPFRGGVGRYCYNLFREYAAESYLVATDQEEILPGANAIRIRLLCGLIRPRWLCGIVQVRALVLKHRIKMIFTPHMLPLGIIAYWIRRLYGIPYVISLHGLDINSALSSRPRLSRRILNNAHAIVTNSAATRKALDGMSVTTPIHVVIPGKDHVTGPSKNGGGSAESARPVYDKLILTVGRLVRRKGQDMVIRALATVKRTVPSVQYVIIGRGPDYGYFQSLIEQMGVSESVTILTDVADEEVHRYYEKAALFAMPTRRRGADVEGFGIVFLQAAAYGLPIIAGDSWAEREAVGDENTAIIVDGRNVQQISESLIALLTDDAFARYLGERGRQRLQTLPTWRDQSKKIKQLLNA